MNLVINFPIQLSQFLFYVHHAPDYPVSHSRDIALVAKAIVQRRCTTGATAVGQAGKHAPVQILRGPRARIINRLSK
jgi:hypothetical protein